MAPASKSPPRLQGRIEAELICKHYCSASEQLLAWGTNDYSFHIRGQTTIAVALSLYRFAHALW